MNEQICLTAAVTLGMLGSVLAGWNIGRVMSPRPAWLRRQAAGKRSQGQLDRSLGMTGPSPRRPSAQ